MVENGIQSALILEDDFEFQENFAQRLGQYLEEARGEDWNLMYLGRNPQQSNVRRVSEHVVEPGYSLSTVAYIIRLDAAKALLERQVERAWVPLDHYFSWAMGHSLDDERAREWR